MDFDNLTGVDVCNFSEKTRNPSIVPNKILTLPELMKQQVEPTDDLKQIYYCNVCNLDLNSKIVYQQHLKGFKHVKRENFFKLKPNQIQTQNEMEQNNQRGFKCDTCNIVLISKITYEQHMLGQKHLKRVETLNNTNINLRCDVCNIDLPNKEQMETHLTGKRHSKKLKIIEKINDVANSISKAINKKLSKSQTDETNSKQANNVNSQEQFKCDKCNLNLISKDQLTIHLAGKKHAKKLLENSIQNKTVSSNPEKKSPSTNDQFENLKIAWDKYTIKDELKEKLKGKYDFYCELCNKYMQKKLQLVDHLKSKKHHRKIYEKRNQLTEKANGKRIQFVKKKTLLTKPSTGVRKQRINFVSSKNNENLINNNNSFNNTQLNTNTFYQMYNSSLNNIDLNAAFEQPISDDVYSSIKPGYVQYYNPSHQITQPLPPPSSLEQHQQQQSSTYPPPLMSTLNQENCTYNKRKYDSSVLEKSDQMSTYYDHTKYLKNNDSISIPAYTNPNTYGCYTTNYENISPLQTNPTNYDNNNEHIKQTENLKTVNPSDCSNYHFDMFSNMALLQYTTAYAVAKQNIK